MKEISDGKKIYEELIASKETEHKATFQKALTYEGNLLMPDIFIGLQKALIFRLHPNPESRIYQLIFWGYDPLMILSRNNFKPTSECATEIITDINRDPKLREKILSYLVQSPSIDTTI